MPPPSRSVPPRSVPPRSVPPRSVPPRSVPARPVRARRGRPVRLGNSRRRLRASVVLLGFVLSLFVGRLFQLQGLDAAAYAETAEKSRLRTVTLPAVRGTIRDANGVALATSVEARNVTVDQTLVRDPARTAAQLAPLLHVDARTLTPKLTGVKRFAYLAKGVTPAVWRRVSDLQLPGIFSEKASTRVYPAGTLAANVVGFVDSAGAGSGGVERQFDAQLAGRDGTATYETGPGGSQIPLGSETTREPVPGSDVTLTIDRDVQWVAQDAIRKKVKEADAQSGTVVVWDVQTGDILALATAPTFDPNRAGKTEPDLLGNRAVSEIYEPGSTSKVMTAAAALEEGVATPETPVTVPNVIERGGVPFHDHDTHPTQYLTFAGVLAKSSNIGTIQIAERMSPETLHRYISAFGVGQPTGLGFPGESRGILADWPDWSATQRVTIPFGQGLSVNAIQATSVFATIADDGVRTTPRLVKGWTDADGRFTPAPEPARQRVVSPQTARGVREMMEGVVSEGGTAKGVAEIPGYRIAAKTGTANRVDGTCGCYRGFTASFIGLAPADQPRLVASVTLQDPKRGHFGGRLGGPVFKQVMSFALQQLRVPPTGTPPPALRLETRPAGR